MDVARSQSSCYSCQLVERLVVQVVGDESAAREVVEFGCQ